jgi:microcystin-dependent protein
MGQPFVGEIRMFGGNFAPAGWEFCNGQLLLISENETLFQLIGTTYGGDGQETFALPNLQSRIPFHAGQMQLAEMGGVETVTLTQNQMPVHSHLATASGAPATNASPANAVPATWGDGQYSTTAPNASFDPSAVSPVGGNQPHENRPPYVAVSFIISLFGIFPPQN